MPADRSDEKFAFEGHSRGVIGYRQRDKQSPKAYPLSPCTIWLAVFRRHLYDGRGRQTQDAEFIGIRDNINVAR